MESNGKGVDPRRAASRIRDRCAGAGASPATNAQHSVLQLLHQGTATVALDLPGASQCIEPLSAAAESRASRTCWRRPRRLRSGSRPSEVRARAGRQRECASRSRRGSRHTRAHAGDRAVSLILLSAPDAAHARPAHCVYEHKVFVQSVIWDINPFDQWGVELGEAGRLGDTSGRRGNRRERARAAAGSCSSACASLA